jgi:transposase InsO family protein
MDIGRTCTADDVVAIIERLVATRGAAPEHLRKDNGPELIAWALRDWCRIHATTTSYIEPGSPWENPFVESFNGRARDELLNIEEFSTLLEAQVVIGAWRVEYNTSPTPLVSRRAHPRRVRRAVDRQSISAPMTTGPLTGTPAGRSVRREQLEAGVSVGTHNVHQRPTASRA